jgi:hypothetical protein
LIDPFVQFRWLYLRIVVKLPNMKASSGAALTYLAVLVIGYAIGFFDGAPPEAPIAVGPLLLFFIIAALLIAKVAAWFFVITKRYSPPDSSGPGDAAFPLMPRPPAGRPPVLSAHNTF